MSDGVSPVPAVNGCGPQIPSVDSARTEQASDAQRLLRDLDVQEVEVPRTADALAHFFSDL
jgi:hypothetical protein